MSCSWCSLAGAESVVGSANRPASRVFGRLVRCVPPLCERCGAPGPWPVRRCAECSGRRLAFARARAALVYEARARAFVASWKERGRRDLATVAASMVVGVRGAARRRCDHVRSRRPRSRPATGPRPGRGARGRAGGALVAPAARLLVAPTRNRASTGPATSRTAAERCARVHGQRAPAPRRVCLVDDVYTTGSTVDGVRRRASPRGSTARVSVVCLARAVR